MIPSLKANQNSLHLKKICPLPRVETKLKRVGYFLSQGNHTVISSSLSPPHYVVCGLWAHGFNDEALVRHQKARGKLAAVTRNPTLVKQLLGSI